MTGSWKRMIGTPSSETEEFAYAWDWMVEQRAAMLVFGFYIKRRGATTRRRIGGAREDLWQPQQSRTSLHGTTSRF